MKKFEIKKDQLLPTRGFISFCNEEITSFGWGRMHVKEQFLEAAKKEKLIKPIIQIKEKIKQDDGTEKIGLVDYYSPHQIFMMVALQENLITEDGLLQSPDSVDQFQDRPKADRPRYITWGNGMSYWVGHKKRPGDKMLHAPEIAEYLHKFLSLIHCLELPPRHLRKEQSYSNKENFSIEYNFEPLQSEGKQLLKVYGLNSESLKKLRVAVGHIAQGIDPLVQWHYYIKKHPKFRRDELKKDASVAQELYSLYYLVEEVDRIVTGEEFEPIFEFLHRGFPASSHTPKNDYLTGEDIQAIKHSVEGFREWLKERGNKAFVTKEILEKFSLLEKEVIDYEKRYGDRSYAGNVRETTKEATLKADDLDTKARWYFDNIFTQSPDSDAQEEIANAISYRLGDLQRNLRDIFWHISQIFQNKKHEVWNEINGNRGGGDLWMRLTQQGKLQNLTHPQQVELVRKERKKLEKIAEGWDKKDENFYKKTLWFVNLALCKACRKNPVKLHIENNSLNMWEASRSDICDECIKNTKELRSIKGAEWNCRYCGKMLYKFARNNILDDLLKNTVPANITLEYGQINATVRCPNPNCKEENSKTIEWGWLP